MPVIDRISRRLWRASERSAAISEFSRRAFVSLIALVTFQPLSKAQTCYSCYPGAPGWFWCDSDCCNPDIGCFADYCSDYPGYCYGDSNYWCTDSGYCCVDCYDYGAGAPCVCMAVP